MRRLLLAASVGLFAVSAHATPTDGLLDPCSPAAVTGAENELFKDMPPGSLGYQEAKLLYYSGITSGCQASPLLFCPTCEISRAAIVTLIVKAANLPLVNPSTPTFADVPANSPFYQYIETAAANNITAGCGGGNFCPNAPVPRSQGAALVAKGAGLAPVSPATPSFSDVPASDPYYGYVEALKKNCVTSGCSATTFCPTHEMTRAEAAAFIARAFDLGNINPCIGATDAGADATSDAAFDASGGGTSGGGTSGSGATGGGASGGASGGTTANGGSGASGGGWTDGGIPPTGGQGGGSAGSKADSTTEDQGGCGCRMESSRSLPALVALAIGVAIAVVRRSRPR